MNTGLLARFLFLPTNQPTIIFTDLDRRFVDVDFIVVALPH